MGRITDALKRAAQNGGRTTVVGGEMTSYAADKQEHLDIAHRAQKYAKKGMVPPKTKKK